MYTRNAPPEGFDARCWERHSSRDIHITWRVAKKHQVKNWRPKFFPLSSALRQFYNT